MLLAFQGKSPVPVERVSAELPGRGISQPAVIHSTTAFHSTHPKDSVHRSAAK